jgi:hypothetical protein
MGDRAIARTDHRELTDQGAIQDVLDGLGKASHCNLLVLGGSQGIPAPGAVQAR